MVENLWKWLTGMEHFMDESIIRMLWYSLLRMLREIFFLELREGKE